MDQQPKSKSEPSEVSGERVSDRAARGAHEAVDRVAEHARSAEDHLRQSASRAAEQARVSAEQVSERGRRYGDEIQQFVMERPLTSLGIAFAAGYLLARMGRH